MSKQDLIKVVQRSINDAAFRRQLAADATGALRGYSLTPDEIGALRSNDSGKLTAFGVDTRMSKVFVIDQGAIGSATITSGEPRDVAPVWIGDSATRAAVQSPDAAERNAGIIGDPSATGSGVQSPDAAERNLAYGSGEATATGGVQSPDAADRNLAFSTTSSEPRDSEPVWIGDTAETPTGAVQSPDAMDRNLLVSGSGAEPRDVEPTWIGDTSAPLHTYSGDDNAGPTDTEVDGGGGSIHQE